MGRISQIEYCDSTLNLAMGCDGCELWNPEAGIRRCWAGNLIERYAGLPGWPMAFEQPALFPERLDAALGWRDLTGTDRVDKPWLNGLPRVIFLCDLADAFTLSLPTDWLAPHLPRIAESPHVWLLLTKQAQRMRVFFERHSCPPNLWPGLSVTGPGQEARIRELMHIGAHARWLSYEPALGEVDAGRFLTNACEGPRCVGGETWNGDALVTCATCQGTGFNGLDWVIVGGESGPGARPCYENWIRDIVLQCSDAKIPCFVKQYGSNPRIKTPLMANGEVAEDLRLARVMADDPLSLKSRKGDDPSEWPADLRVRQMPETTDAEALDIIQVAYEGRLRELESDLARLRGALENLRNRNGEPEYHSQGMGCGLEDRDI